MANRTPSKKILFLIVACIFAVGLVGYAAYSSRDGSGNKSGAIEGAQDLNNSRQAQAIETISRVLKENSEQDDDSDGLMNWEEALWGTDPKRADTDGDGTPDGEEAKQSRNPLIKGPNDALTTTKVSTSGSTEPQENIPQTKTAQISRDLFATYMQAKKAGTGLDESIQNEIIRQAFSNKSFAVSYKQYTTNEITVAKTGDFTKYGNDLGFALSIGKTNDPRTEIDILQAAMSENRESEITSLDPIIQGYTGIIDALALVSVPQDLVGFHIEFLNSMGRVLSDIKGFRMMFDDPIVGLVSVGNYFNDVQALQLSIQNIKSALEEKDITFKQGEYGYVFMNTI